MLGVHEHCHCLLKNEGDKVFLKKSSLYVLISCQHLGRKK